MTSMSVRARPGRSDTFLKNIGWYSAPDGAVREKVWYFVGVSESVAIARAAELKAVWQQIKRSGSRIWPADFVPSWVANPIPFAMPVQAPQPREVKVGSLTLEDCLKLYRTDLTARAGAGQISVGRAQTACNFSAKGVEHLGKTSLLSQVGLNELEGLVRHFCSRPLTTTGKPMAEESVKSYVSNCGSFFRWLSKQPAIGWKRPDNFDDIWQVGRVKPKTEAERKEKYLVSAGGGVKTFTVEDLRKLYRVGTSMERAWMLLGLNCAFQNVDISDLRAYEVHKATGGKPPMVIRTREKTGVDGRWVLWPETMAAIQAAGSKDNQHERVFLTPDGNLLMPRSGRTDYVGQRWRKVKKSAELADGLGFKYLRKTSCDGIFQMTGRMELQEAHATHKELAPMAPVYVNRLWADLAEAQAALRERFVGVWS